jgi:Ca2+-dependent lipid-binding protein
MNEIITLDGDQEEKNSLRIDNFGSVYLSAVFVPATMKLQKTPTVIEYYEEVKETSYLQGVLQIKIVHAKGIMKGDNDDSDKGSSDPYVKIFWPQEGKVDQTSVRKYTLTPVWNEEFKYPSLLDFYVCFS